MFGPRAHSDGHGGRRMKLSFRRLGMRARIALCIAGAMVLLTVVGSVLAVRIVQSRFIDGVDRDLELNSRELAVAIELVEPELLVEIAERGIGVADSAVIVMSPTAVSVAIPSGTGTDRLDPLPDVEAIGIAALRARAGVPFELPADGDTPAYRVQSTPLANGDVLIVATSLAGVQEAVKAVVHALVLVAIVTTALLTAVVSIVVSWLTRPLLGIIDTAEQISAGELDRRIELRERSVDDVVRLGGVLNRMLDSLQQALDDRTASEDKLRRFVADASHELRTPLSAVLGYAELHRSGIATSPEQVDEVIERIAAEGERMRLLVEELLMLARLDHGRPASVQTIDLVELVAVAVADARAVAPERAVRFEPPADVQLVRADAMSVRQAVDNLLANTRAHTPEDAAVEVVLEPAGDRQVVRIVVDDGGPGIATADRSRVFDRFYRTESARSRSGKVGVGGGNGLGLAIVAAVAEAHGGSVAVEESPLGGARFVLALPSAAASVTAP